MLNQSQNKRLLAVHGWSATILGLFLYVVILTGAVAVFASEIGQWSASGTRAAEPLDRPLDAKLRSLAETVDPKYLEEVTVFGNSGGVLTAFFHTHEKNADGNIEDVGVRFRLDPNTMEVLHRDEGTRSEMPSDQEGALDDFIVDLHVYLHAPRPWGLWATGILGFVMLIAVVSGIFLHKHLLKDLFVAPRFSSLLLNRRDRHILAGSWSLPFGFVLAFTGAFFSFAGAISIPVMSMVAFGGDQEKMIEALIGHTEVENATPAELANLDTIMADTEQRVGAVPRFLLVSHWGRSDASVMVFHEPTEANLSGTRHGYDGVTGAYTGIKPPLGNEPSVGGDLLALMGPLHFGDFGGLLSKTVWFALGLAMCYVTLTGLQLWTQRRADNPSWAFMTRSILIVGYGTAIALVGAAAAFFLSLHAHSATFWTPVGFIVTSAACIVAGFMVKDAKLLSRLFGFALAGGMSLLPLLRMAMGGDGWPASFASGNTAVIGMDLAFFAGTAVMLYWIMSQSEETQPADKAPYGVAAE